MSFTEGTGAVVVITTELGLFSRTGILSSATKHVADGGCPFMMLALLWWLWIFVDLGGILLPTTSHAELTMLVYCMSEIMS